MPVDRVAYRYPDAVQISEAIRQGLVEITRLSEAETEDARRVQAMAGGLHQGESEVLAIGLSRGLPITVTERQASRFARSLGLEVMGLRQLLFEGTPALDRLEQRIRTFATLTQMRMRELDQLMIEINRRRT